MKNPHHDATLKIPKFVWDELIRNANSNKPPRIKEAYFEARMGAGGGSAKIPKNTKLEIDLELP